MTICEWQICARRVFPFTFQSVIDILLISGKNETMQLDPFIITLGLPFDDLYSEKSSPEHQEFTTMVVQM